MIPISMPDIGELEKAAVQDVLESGILAQGPRTALFEERFAKLCGTRHAIAVSSGTTALYIACMANGIGPGDEVITSPFSFIATANAVLFTGARPVFVDIQEATFNMDPDLIEAAITPRTKAIIPVHLYGYMCDMAKIQALSEKYGLKIIEDACQSVGATYMGRPAGSFGTGVFSFYATKNLTTAEGGMITTDDDTIAEKSRLLRNHGMKRRYYHDLFGFNFRMTDLQAGIGLVQLGRLDEFTAKRSATAAYYTENIKSVITPCAERGYGHVWHQYTVRINSGRNRDFAAQILSDAGIGTGIYYPVPIHKQVSLKEVVGEDVSLPVAERMAGEVLSLPIHTKLTSEDREVIVREVNKL